MDSDLTNKQKPQPKLEIVAVIPCLNEERFIGSVVIKTRKYVDRVIVIDDGSIDATAEVATEAGATVFQHDHNRGYGSAIRSAIEKGRECGAGVLVIIDGDGQHDPRDIKKLLKPILAGEADVVIGSRFLGGSKRPPLYRRLGMRVLTAVTNLGSGQRISDSQSGFRAYTAKALDELTLTEDGMSVSSEIQFAINKSSLRIAEVPIDVSYVDEVKRNPVSHGVSVLSRVLVLFSLKQPLLFFGLPGLVILAIGLAFGTRVLTVFSETQILLMGYAMVTVLLCLVGILALFTALILYAMKELLRGLSSSRTRDEST